MPQGPIISLRISIPIALAIMGILALYWISLSRHGIPRSRRRIRRANTIIHLATLPALVYAASVVDSAADPGRFVVAWIGVLSLAFLSICLAVADTINTIRLQRRDRNQLRHERLQARAGRENPAGTDDHTGNSH